MPESNYLIAEYDEAKDMVFLKAGNSYIVGMISDSFNDLFPYWWGELKRTGSVEIPFQESPYTTKRRAA